MRCLDSLGRLGASILVCLTLSVYFPAPSQAQTKKKVGLPKPKAFSLTSRDGVQVRCNYYPGGVIERLNADREREYANRSGKEVVPVILLHGWGGNRKEYSYLAGVLQRQGHAVIIPDFRGHGESMIRRFPNGAEVKLDRDRIRPADMPGLLLDVEAAKKFLLKENNEGLVNIEQLTIVGAEAGAIIAINWAQQDWSRRQLPSFKQGQDIKALILLSPESSFKGISTKAAFKHPVVASRLSMLIITGKADRKGYSDARAIHKRLAKMHREPANPEDEDLFLVELETSLRGTRLIYPRARLGVEQHIVSFIERRLVAQSAYFSWHERRNPLDSDE